LPTPSIADGSFSLDPILDVCGKLGLALKGKHEHHIVIVSSTVSPGSCGGLIAETLERTSGRRIGVDLGLCYSPETVALGSVMRGFLEPEFVLVGELDSFTGDRIEEFYRRFCGDDVPIYRTNLINAEIAKMTLNCYVAMKITFANEMAEFCERFSGADADVVSRVIGSDSRIGGKCLKGATAYGGNCFPRDTSALVHAAESIGTRSLLMDAVSAANRWQNRRLALLVRRCIEERYVETVGILGLAFKSGTNVVQGSAGVMLLQLFQQFRLAKEVIAFDPIVQVGQSVRTAQDCVDRADLVIVTIPCDEFKSLVFRNGQTVIDCWRIYDGRALESNGVNYVALGLGFGNA